MHISIYINIPNLFYTESLWSIRAHEFSEPAHRHPTCSSHELKEPSAFLIIHLSYKLKNIQNFIKLNNYVYLSVETLSALK